MHLVSGRPPWATKNPILDKNLEFRKYAFDAPSINLWTAWRTPNTRTHPRFLNEVDVMCVYSSCDVEEAAMPIKISRSEESSGFWDRILDAPNIGL